ncbi:MAG: hypothetical protein QM724_01990 [Flavobacteriales bacterium]
MRRLLVAGLLIAGPAAEAQLLDSIALFTERQPKLVVKLDTRGSFISNQNVSLWGLKVGLEHAGRFQYGIGYSFLRTRVEGVRHVDGLGAVDAHLRFGYFTPYVEYAFYQRGPWEVRIPVQFGIGGGSVVYRDANGDTQKLARSAIFLYEPSMTVQYRFLKYFGAGAGWGYRLVFGGGGLGEHLTAPIYVLGMKVFFGDLWRDVRTSGDSTGSHRKKMACSGNPCAVRWSS